MSLWFASLSNCFYDCENQEDRIRCIVSHLSMPVPRQWWESCIKNEKRIPDYAEILNDLHKELIKSKKFKWVDHSILLALAFIDDERTGNQPEFGSVDSQYSLEEYFEGAKAVLAQRPELKKLAQKMISV